ncbi:hypothetical protein LMG29542_07685 [Paraburkholderia humisilvae]|uniref:Uncharacterized protein n=1 Tax=Paraburkholderia humisilvae TaxID=627669 RepID=A0A6J5F725_9BURK|nr:hypothetical protein LMG29542_07685 [Paraburkholderia humisilvae]
MGFRDFRCARIILTGIGLMHMIRKGQMRDDANRTAAAQFYSLITYAVLLISAYSSSHRYRDTTIGNTSSANTASGEPRT